MNAKKFTALLANSFGTALAKQGVCKMDFKKLLRYEIENKQNKKYDAWLNPRGNEAQKFSVGKKTVVIRPSISRESSNVHFANIEKILVDIFVEATTLNLMDEDEYFHIFGSILESGRINVGTLLNYAGRRKLKTEWFVEKIKSV